MYYHYTAGVAGRKINRIGLAAIATAFAAVASLSIFAQANAAVPLAYSPVPFTQAELDTNWVTDRTTPSGGYESVSFGGRTDVAELRVDGDNASPTPGFYRTEGIQRQVGDVAAVKADLYVDSAWLGSDVRAGLWGVGHDSTNVVSAYPIAEFTTMGDGDFTGWRVWDGVNGGWTNLPGVGYNADEWNTVEVAYNSTTNEFEFSVNGSEVATSVGDVTTNLGAVILNNFNTGVPGQDYAVRWSNFALGTAFANPETKDACKDGGWTAYGFANQGQCIRFVVTGQDSRL